MFLAVTILAASLFMAFDVMYCRRVLDQKPLVVNELPSEGSRVWLVFPGFSNPVEPLGFGMRQILDGYLLVLDSGSYMDFEAIYAAMFDKLRLLYERAKEPLDILIDGHSMGGMIGAKFLERYGKDGSPFGPIHKTVLDCTPTCDSLRASPRMARLLRVVLKHYHGGLVLSLAIALGNIVTRVRMPMPLSDGADRQNYPRYARGIMWYNPRAWTRQLLYMLTFELPAVQETAFVHYLHATDPERDIMVDQHAAMSTWGQVFPDMHGLASPDIIHACPLERPKTYRQLMGIGL